MDPAPDLDEDDDHRRGVRLAETADEVMAIILVLSRWRKEAERRARAEASDPDGPRSKDRFRISA